MKATQAAYRPTILILDDDPTMLLFLEEYLNDGYDVCPFRDGPDALSWLEAGNRVDGVIVDLNMPGMDGLSFVRSAKQLKLLASTPILVLSGSDKSADRIAGLQAGAVDFIRKPFNPQELQVRLEIQLPKWGDRLAKVIGFKPSPLSAA